MSIPALFRHTSLKARVTVFTFLVFLLCVLAMNYYVSWTLHANMQKMLGEQQYSAVTLIAEHLNEELEDRIWALNTIADEITPAMVSNPSRLQTLLEHRPLLKLLFNGGIFATGTNGTAISSVPLSAGRIGVNYMDREVVFLPLRQGKTVVGQPAMGKKLGAPVFSITVPIHGAQGRIVGALVGTINLGLPNFLDKFTQNHYGQTGGYLLVAKDQRLIVTATDKSRIMEKVSDHAMANRLIGGFEGTSVFTNHQGVEVLSSVKGIPLANWFLAVSVPTAEVFSPIYKTQRQMLLAAIILCTLACGMTWWFLRRQLFPVLGSVETLARMANHTSRIGALPLVDSREVRDLIVGFNRVLKTLDEREASLLKSEQFGRTIINSVHAEIAVLDSQGTITAVNEPWRCFVAKGGTQSGVATQRADIGSNYMEVCRAAAGTNDEAVALRVSHGIQSVLDRSLPFFAMEYRCDWADQEYWFWLMVTPLEVADGGAIVSHEDITQRKRAELELTESERRFEHFMNTLPAVAFIKGEDGRLIFANRYMEEVLGVSEWKGRPAAELFAANVAERMVAVDRRAWETGYASSEDVVPDALGQPRIFQTYKFRLPSEGTERLVGGIALDISALKQIAQELAEAKSVAESANNAKSRFLAAASHDLRQPLAALALYVGMLSRPGAMDNQALIGGMQECIASLSSLLGDLLDLSKLDAGVVIGTQSDFCLDDLGRQLLRTHGAIAKTKGIQIRWKPSDFVVRSDHTLLQRILGNLIHNAIKFTSRGGILIAYRQHDGRHWVEVWDTGVGMENDQIDLVFEEFRQLGDLARNSGSGLGLSIVAKTAALLGLAIRVRSRPGRGSMFAVELKEGMAPLRLPLPASSSAHRSLVLGIVEDNRQVQDALVRVLEGAGHRVLSGSSGREMLKRMVGHTPDVIISDYRLALGETGFDVIAAARSVFGADLPAIIVTGDTDPALIRSMRGPGIEVLYKPLNMEILLASIVQLAQVKLA